MNTNNKSDSTIQIVLIVLAVLLLIGAAVGLSDVFNNSDSPIGGGSDTVLDTDKVTTPDTEGAKVCNHLLDTGTITVTANCTRMGRVLFACTKCDYTETKTIAKTNHKYTYTTTAATSTTHGQRIKSCTTPGCSFTPVVEVLHYSYGDGYCVVCQQECEHQLEPTYDWSGFESGAYCPLCGYHEGY